MALIMFSQSFSGAMFLSFSGTIFTHSLKNMIPRYASSVDPKAVITVGATGFRNIISGNDLASVLVAYAKSVNPVFYLCAGAAFGCFAFAWGMGWKDIRTQTQVSKA